MSNLEINYHVKGNELVRVARTDCLNGESSVELQKPNFTIDSEIELKKAWASAQIVHEELIKHQIEKTFKMVDVFPGVGVCLWAHVVRLSHWE